MSVGNHRLQLTNAMKNLNLYLNVLPVVGLLIMSSSTLGNKYKKDDWVDLNDLMNYDRGTKTMKYHSSKSAKTNECCLEEHYHQVLEFKEKLSECENILLLMKRPKSNVNAANISKPLSQPVDSNVRASSIKAKEVLYINRFVNILLRVSGLGRVTLEPNQLKEVSVQIKVNFEQLKKLQSFSQHEGTSATLEEIDDILSEVLQSSGLQHYLREEFHNFLPSTDTFYKLSHYLIVITVSIMVFFRQRKSEIVLVIVMMLVAADYTWTSDYLIKMNEIKQYVTMEKKVPSACSELGFLDYLLSAFRQPPDCTEYYMAKMMPSSLIVTPGMVVSEMFSTLIVHPMDKLGQGISKFSSGVLGDLGWFVGPAVLTMVFVLFTAAIVCIIILSCGGRYRLPFFFGELSGPSESRRRRSSPSPSRVEEIAPSTKSVTYITNHFHPSKPTAPEIKCTQSDFLTHKSLVASASSIKDTCQGLKDVPVEQPTMAIEADHFLDKITQAFDVNETLETSKFLDAVESILLEEGTTVDDRGDSSKISTVNERGDSSKISTVDERGDSLKIFTVEESADSSKKSARK